jgi:hypothetical protein
MAAASQAARASGRPAMVSWSVSASVETRRVRARSTSAAGASTPSEKLLCVWKSTSVSLPASIQGSV